jgi:hypothetical protein
LNGKSDTLTALSFRLKGSPEITIASDFSSGNSALTVRLVKRSPPAAVLVRRQAAVDQRRRLIERRWNGACRQAPQRVLFA